MGTSARAPDLERTERQSPRRARSHLGLRAPSRAGIEWIRAPGMGTASGTTGKLTLAEISSAPFDSIALR